MSTLKKSKPASKRTAKRAKKPSVETPEVIDADGLTIRQRMFVDEYLMCLNGTEAARRAKYKGNANVLGVTAHDNLRNPKISELIQKRLAESSMSADEVLARLGDHARGTLAYFMNGGEIDLTSKAAHAHFHLLKKARVTHGVTKSGEPWTSTEIEIHDPQAALVHMGRHHKLFVERMEHTGKDGTPLPSMVPVIYLPDNGRSNNPETPTRTPGEIPSQSG